MLVAISKRLLLVLSGIFLFINARAQQKVLDIKEAEQIALSNYGTIKAKANQLNSSIASLKETKTEYLPDLNISAQQAYGTINGTNGPIDGYRGLAVASSGPALPTQNWHAAVCARVRPPRPAGR